MTRFIPNKYLIKVTVDGQLLNAFEIPAKNYPSAQFHAHAIVLSLYPQSGDELVIDVKRV